MPLAFAWLWFGGLGILYLILLITAGVLTLRNRHIVLFIIGIIFPILWIIGAIMSPRSRY
jgi:hypothetical protein